MANADLVCIRCGHRALQWHGRCPGCGAWDSLAQEGPGEAAPAPVALSKVDLSSEPRLASGIGEFDRVVGGGLVPGTVTLIAGEPGVGKSTLALQVGAGIQRRGFRVVLVIGEESLEQVAARAARVAGAPDIGGAAATDVTAAVNYVGQADLLIVDSIQTLRHPEISSAPGSPLQVRVCASAMGQAARSSGAAVMLIGHVTKDGAVAGPRVLEHLVDVVCTFEGEADRGLRMIRSVKNRYGPTSEIGVFEMRGSGLVEVPDASGLLLEGRRPGISGSAVTCVLEGKRPVALEVQALTVESGASVSRRISNGIDNPRLVLMTAVLEKRALVTFSKHDAYARIAGGISSRDPGLDLALALALAGSRKGTSLPPETVVLGEVGLGGEIRKVVGLESRLSEAQRLGFRTAIVPPSNVSVEGIAVQPVSEVAEAVNLLR